MHYDALASFLYIIIATHIYVCAYQNHKSTKGLATFFYCSKFVLSQLLKVFKLTSTSMIG